MSDDRYTNMTGREFCAYAGAVCRMIEACKVGGCFEGSRCARCTKAIADFYRREAERNLRNN